MSATNDPWQALIVDDADLPEEVEEWSDDVVTTVLPLAPTGRDDAWPDREGRVVVVLGATGGAGATTVACGLALALARSGPGTTLIDLDFEFGDTHERWDVPRHRTLADLVPVLGELRPAHLDLVGYAHPSGVDLCLSPAQHGASGDWGGDDVTTLLSCAARRGPVVVDVGRAAVHHMVAACGVADTVIVLSPATLRGARRTRELADRCPTGRVRVMLSGSTGSRPELSSRAFAAACGRPVDVALPTDRREATQLRSGIWRTSRRGVQHQIAAFVETDLHVAR